MDPLDEIAALAAEASERFAAESAEIDQAYRDGRLHEWIDAKLAELKGGDDADDGESNDGDSGSGDSGGPTSGA
jgi:hypothetical protein